MKTRSTEPPIYSPKKDTFEIFPLRGDLWYWKAPQVNQTFKIRVRGIDHDSIVIYVKGHLIINQDLFHMPIKEFTDNATWIKGAGWWWKMWNPSPI